MLRNYVRVIRGLSRELEDSTGKRDSKTARRRFFMAAGRELMYEARERIA